MGKRNNPAAAAAAAAAAAVRDQTTGSATGSPFLATAATPASSMAAASPVKAQAPKAQAPKAQSSASQSNAQSWDRVLLRLYGHYFEATPQRTKLLDIFMVFLAVLGGVQFAYCVLAGNYPFNAFLSGFSGTVGQFILTASLRTQVTNTEKLETRAISPERALTDYIVCSLILHFFCVNFIN